MLNRHADTDGQLSDSRRIRRMKKEYEPLFTPWKIGNVEIPNRIVQTSPCSDGSSRATLTKRLLITSSAVLRTALDWCFRACSV